jgi:hypothetical protein
MFTENVMKSTNDQRLIFSKPALFPDLFVQEHRHMIRTIILFLNKVKKIM